MRLPLVVAVVCLLVAPMSQGAEAKVDARRELLRVEAELCHAIEVGDVAVVKRDLDETFTLTSSRGNVTDYASNVAEVAKRDPAYEMFRNHDQKVRLYGDAAIITGVTSIKGHSGKDAVDGDFQYTDTWVRRDGHWKIAASHASRLPAKTP